MKNLIITLSFLFSKNLMSTEFIVSSSFITTHFTLNSIRTCLTGQTPIENEKVTLSERAFTCIISSFTSALSSLALKEEEKKHLKKLIYQYSLNQQFNSHLFFYTEILNKKFKLDFLSFEEKIQILDNLIKADDLNKSKSNLIKVTD